MKISNVLNFIIGNSKINRCSSYKIKFLKREMKIKSRYDLHLLEEETNSFLKSLSLKEKEAIFNNKFIISDKTKIALFFAVKNSPGYFSIDPINLFSKSIPTIDLAFMLFNSFRIHSGWAYNSKDRQSVICLEYIPNNVKNLLLLVNFFDSIDNVARY